MYSLVDTHCHLDFDAFREDLPEVLQRSREANVIRWVVPGVSIQSSHKGLELANQDLSIYCTVGVHPTEAFLGVEIDFEAARIKELAQNPKVCAIGEIGLDFYHKNTDPKDQSRRFLAHLAIAADLELPVVIHSRQAMRETLDLLEQWCSELKGKGSLLTEHPGVLHAFEGCREDADRGIKLGFYIGVGGPITFTNAADRREVCASIDLEHIVLETDAPFLTPQQYRGKRNEPAYVRLIAEKVAELHGITLERVAEITSRNASSLFGWSNLN